jgi:hypothetical protein
MKTYISVGIGDMMCLDSVLSQNERDQITEIYWACRFGDKIAPLMTNNPFYPNLTQQYFISDEDGIQKMSQLEPGSENFWHFRPDFEKSYQVGLELFNITHLKNEIWAINSAGIFLDKQRLYNNSSFLENAKLESVDWEKLKISPNNYILFHYPTSTRPRSDIATIDDSDWNYINELSKKENLKVVIISDAEIEKKIDNSIILINPPIHSIITLTKFSSYYAGCDSFVSILSAKVHKPEKLFIKSHNKEIQNHVLSSVWLQRFFLPYSAKEISSFYRNYIGK